MAIALFALSLVMIVGGAAAVVQGFPYVRLESGLAMVIGGTTAASAGAVVLSVAAAMLQVRKLADALDRRGPVATPAPLPLEPVLPAPAFTAPALEAAPLVSSEPIAATAGAAGLAGVSLGGVRDRLGGGDARPAIDPLPGRRVEVEPPLPNLLPPAVPGPIAPPAPAEPIVADADLFASPEDRPGYGPRAAADEPHEAVDGPEPSQEELALRPALDEPADAPHVEHAPHEPEPEPEPAPEAAETSKREELQVVGTYSSGANTYVMFANGTIQADTPQGQFTFQSLDELKEFVDSGGETGARGAA